MVTNTNALLNHMKFCLVQTELFKLLFHVVDSGILKYKPGLMLEFMLFVKIARAGLTFCLFLF